MENMGVWGGGAEGDGEHNGEEGGEEVKVNKNF